jgi:hypothetical protein
MLERRRVAWGCSQTRASQDLSIWDSGPLKIAGVFRIILRIFFGRECKHNCDRKIHKSGVETKASTPHQIPRLTAIGNYDGGSRCMVDASQIATV